MNRRSAHRLGACALLVLLALAAPALAAESAADHLHPRLDRARYGALLDALALDREQRLIAEILVADYLGAMGELAAETDRRAEAAGRDRVEAALAGRGAVDPDALRDMRAMVIETYLDAQTASDELLGDLLDGLYGTLTEAQLARAPALMADLRRDLWLAPRRRDAHHGGYAGEGMDLLLLVEDGRADGGALAGVPGNDLDPVLESYRATMDQLLAETGPAERAGSLRRRLARIRHDAEVLRAEREAEITRWRRFDGLNRDIARRIGELAAAHAGDGARAAWTAQVERARFPWMDGGDDVERLADWLTRQPVADGTRRSIEAVIATYRAERAPLRDALREQLLRARRELGVAIWPGMDPLDVPGNALPLHQALLRNSGARARLEQETVDRILGLLDDDLRERAARVAR